MTPVWAEPGYRSIGTKCVIEFLVVVAIMKSADKFVHTFVVNILLLLLTVPVAMSKVDINSIRLPMVQW